jgi:hypothetical protein
MTQEANMGWHQKGIFLITSAHSCHERENQPNHISCRQLQGRQFFFKLALI